MKKLTTALLLALFFIGLACEKESNLSNGVKTSSSINVQDGRLVFKKMEDLHQWVQKFSTSKNEAKQLANLEDFTSFQEAFESIDLNFSDKASLNKLLDEHKNILTMWREGSDTYLDKNSYGVFYPHICNANGIFQIGDSLYKVTREKLFSFHSRHINMVDQIFDIPGVKIRDHVISTSHNAGSPELRNNVEDCESYYNNNKRKLKGRNGIEYAPGNFFVFSASSTHYKRGFLGIWSQEDVAAISVSCGGWTDDCPPTSNSNYLENESQVGAILCSGYASSNNVSFEMSSSHESTRVGTSGVASCNILNGD